MDAQTIERVQWSQAVTLKIVCDDIASLTCYGTYRNCRIDFVPKHSAVGYNLQLPKTYRSRRQARVPKSHNGGSLVPCTPIALPPPQGPKATHGSSNTVDCRRSGSNSRPYMVGPSSRRLKKVEFKVEFSERSPTAEVLNY